MTLAQKVALIEESMQPDFDPVEARERYNIKKSQYYLIVKRDKEKILNMAQYMDGERKTTRLGPNAQVEEELYEWLCAQNVPVTPETLTNQAYQIQPNFNPSKNWMHRFRYRYKNIVYNKSSKTFAVFKKDE